MISNKNLERSGNYEIVSNNLEHNERHEKKPTRLKEYETGIVIRHNLSFLSIQSDIVLSYEQYTEFLMNQGDVDLAIYSKWKSSFFSDWKVDFVEIHQVHGSMYIVKEHSNSYGLGDEFSHVIMYALRVIKGRGIVFGDIGILSQTQVGRLVLRFHNQSHKVLDGMYQYDVSSSLRSAIEELRQLKYRITQTDINTAYETLASQQLHIMCALLDYIDFCHDRKIIQLERKMYAELQQIRMSLYSQNIEGMDVLTICARLSISSWRDPFFQKSMQIHTVSAHMAETIKLISQGTYTHQDIIHFFSLQRDISTLCDELIAYIESIQLRRRNVQAHKESILHILESMPHVR